MLRGGHRRADGPPRPFVTALPEVWYTHPDIWIAERRALFERSWQVVARGIDLPQPGNYRATAIGGLGVIAMRQDDASVRGFRNLCRHQGMPVLAAGEGRCAQIRCAYHGWTYRLDGILAETPPLVAPDDPADIALRGIGAREQDGFVLLRLTRVRTPTRASPRSPAWLPRPRRLSPKSKPATGSRRWSGR